MRRFYPLFWTQFFGAFNDNFLKNALVILITYQGVAAFGIPSGLMVAAAGGVFILPFFLFSATAGQIADKYEKSRIIRWIKLIEIAIMVFAAAGFLGGHFEFLFGVLFLMGLHSAFFGPIKYGILPQLLKADELVRGNALVEAGTFLAILIGSIAGGVLIALPSGRLIVSVALILVAVFGWLTSRHVPEAPPVDPSCRVQWNPVPPTLSILRFTRKNRTVFLSVLGISWFWFFGAAVLSLFPSYCKDVLRADQSVVTLFLATFSIGIGAGSMLCERWSRPRLELGLVPLGSIGISVFVLDLFWVGVPSFAGIQPEGLLIGIRELLSHGEGVRILADLFLMSVSSGFFTVPLYTLMQTQSDPSFRSRTIAGNNVVNALFMVGSALFVMVCLALGATIPQVFLMLGLVNAAASAYIYLLLPEFLMRFIAWVLANAIYRLRVEGVGRVPLEGPAVLVSNHVSFVDWLIISAAVKRPIRFVMDHQFARGPWVKLLLKQAKVILIATQKEDPALLERAFQRVAEELRAGSLVCVFPEGVITRDGGLGPFKPGIERILRETPVPVIPMALQGLWGSFFSRERGRAIMKVPKRFWSRVGLRVGEPIPASDASVDALSRSVSALLKS